MDSPARGLNEPAPYRIIKRCPSCHTTYKSVPGISPCPVCGDVENTSAAPTRRRLAPLTAAPATRIARNWPLAFAAVMLIAAGPLSWAEAGLRLALQSFAGHLGRFAFLGRLTPQLPVSPAILAASGTIVFGIGILVLALSRMEVPNIRARDGEEAPADDAPLELGLPEWLKAAPKSAPEITYKATAQAAAPDYRGYPG